MQLSKSHFGMGVCDIFSEQLLKRTTVKCITEGIEICIGIYPQVIFADAGTWTPGTCRPDTWHLLDPGAWHLRFEPDTWHLDPRT